MMEDIQSLLKVFQEYFQEYFKKALGALWEFSSIVSRALGILQEYFRNTSAIFLLLHAFRSRARPG